MRIQVRISPQMWEHVRRLAQLEHRPPKHQIELLLWTAIEQAAQTKSVQPQPQEVPSASQD